MSKIYKVRTNAYDYLCEIDEENKVVRICHENRNNYPLCNANEVEDTSSWDDDYDYDAIVNEINNPEDAEIEILSVAEFTK